MERDTYPRKWGLGPKVNVNLYLLNDLMGFSQLVTRQQLNTFPPSYPFSVCNCDTGVNNVDSYKCVTKCCTDWRHLEMYVSLAPFRCILKNRAR